VKFTSWEQFDRGLHTYKTYYTKIEWKSAEKNVSHFFPHAFSGANPTIVSYNVSAVKIYNATRSLVRFENKNIFFRLKRSSLLQHNCKLRSRRIRSWSRVEDKMLQNYQIRKLLCNLIEKDHEGKEFS
jgi:hypothetical protein